MKGVILAGGFGTRLGELTKVTNKHLQGVYNHPMIRYPLETLRRVGIDDVVVVCGEEHSGHFSQLLGDGSDYQLSISYAVQPGAQGIADSLRRAQRLVDGHDLAVILGDNIFEYAPDISDFNGGARIFIKEVLDPERFGVATLKDGKVVRIVEKPEIPETNLAVTGFYLYDSQVFDFIRELTPSPRGEYEITAVNNRYIELGKMDARVISGVWLDAGKPEALYQAAGFVREQILRGTPLVPEPNLAVLQQEILQR